MYCPNARHDRHAANRPEPVRTPWRDGVGAELASALCLDSLMLLCSAEHLLDHLDRR